MVDREPAGSQQKKVAASFSARGFMNTFYQMALFLTGKSGLEADRSNDGGSPFEAGAVPAALTQNITTTPGKPDHTRPQSPIELREPAALGARSQRMCWRRVLLQGPAFNQLELFLNNHPIHIFKINCASCSKQSAFRYEDGRWNSVFLAGLVPESQAPFQDASACGEDIY